MRPGFVKLAVLCGLVLLGIHHFVGLVWLSPDIEFLPPSIGAEWLLHPEDCERDPKHLTPSDLSEGVQYGLDFDLESVPKTASIELKAMARFRLTVNGAEAGANDPGRIWKRFQRFDLRPFLTEGPNRLEVSVWNPTGISAFLAKGKIAGRSLNTRTGSDWMARTREDGEWQPCLAAGSNPESRPFNPMRYASIVVYALYAIAILIVLLGVPRFWRRSSGASVRKERSNPLLSERVFGVSVGVIFLALFVLNLHNASVYPYERGIDSDGHVEYIQYIAAERSFPLASEGWEMFQPPGYYTMASVLYSALHAPPFSLPESACLRGVQILGSLLGLANVVLVFLSLRLLFPGKRHLQLLGLLFCAFLPMQLYMNPLITNEVAAGTVITLCLYIGLRYLRAERLPIQRFVWLGVLLALALLTKHTGLFVALTVGVAYLLRAWRRRSRRELTGTFLMLSIAVALSGWFYARNVEHFGDPFVGNWDPQTTFQYEQRPGYRTPEYYLELGSAPFHPKRFDNVWNSFWDGQYATMWSDAHGFYAHGTSPRQRTGMKLVLLLAVLPTLAMVAGLVRSIGSTFRRTSLNPDTMLTLLAALTLASVVHFTMQVPFYSTVKAFFFLSLLIPMTVFAVRGFGMMLENLGRLRWVLYGILGVTAVVNCVTYWY